MKKTFIFALLAINLLLSACGGGGGGNSSGKDTIQTPVLTKAIIKLSTVGLANAQIGGVDATLSLPAGVTVKSMYNPPETDAGVVVASGQAASSSTIIAVSTPASGSSRALVRLIIVNSSQNGISIGEFATITCALTSGVNPTSSDFTIQSSAASDLNGVAITSVSVAASAILQ